MPQLLSGIDIETDELVKESSKLDPLLPPPPIALSGKAGSSIPPLTSGRNNYRVGAAMTDQLLRESAKLVPGSPPPYLPQLPTRTDFE
ncbi:hypothetical protein LJR267_009216 [Paraburkholderia hospita]|uniref:hypothetical protein n=1 Tax=Paraburkholderia hospita TaxID=169430 RepID=UPI003ECCF964